MPNEMYERGLQIRREVLGSEYVDRAIGSADDFNKEFQEILTEYCWGAVWGRPGLSRKQRSLNNIWHALWRWVAVTSWSYISRARSPTASPSTRSRRR